LEFQIKQEEKRNALIQKGLAARAKLESKLSIPQTYQKIMDNQKLLDAGNQITDIAQEAELTWQDFLGSVGDGLQVMGFQLDETTDRALDLANAMMTGNPYAGVISALGLLQSMLADTTPAFKQMLDPLAYDSRLEFVKAELDRAREELEYEEGRVKQLRSEGDIRTAKLIETQTLPGLRVRIQNFEKELQNKLVGVGFGNSMASAMSGAYDKMFDPDNYEDPLKNFTRSFECSIFNELVAVFTANSGVIEKAKELGEYLSWALQDGVISATEKYEIDKKTAWVKHYFNKTTKEFEAAVDVLGIEFEGAGEAAAEKVEEGFTEQIQAAPSLHGFDNAITGAISQAIESGEMENLGGTLAERFNRSFMNTIIEKMLETSALMPLLKDFGEDFSAALEDGVLDPMETAMLSAQKSSIMSMSKSLGRDVDDALRRLDIDFTKAEEESIARREGATETEAFETFSNISRYQANSLIHQLSLHSGYLKSIADTNIRIAELSDTIAKNTQNIGTLQQTVVTNGLDEVALANQQLNQRQAKGLQI